MAMPGQDIAEAKADIQEIIDVAKDMAHNEWSDPNGDTYKALEYLVVSIHASMDRTSHSTYDEQRKPDYMVREDGLRP